MNSFRDNSGRMWQIDLSVGNVMRVRGCDPRFNLFEPSKQIEGRELQHVLQHDLPTFWELLWFIVEQSAGSTTAEEFGRCMSAECLVEAQRAFFAEWSDFFHRLQRPDIATALEKMAKLQAMTLTKVKAALERPEVKQAEQMLEREIESRLNNSVSNLPERVASILAH